MNKPLQQQSRRPAPIRLHTILMRLYSLYRQLKKQEKYLSGYLPNLLRDVAPGISQEFSPAQIKRTTKYWQLSLNLICDNLYQLTGKKLNNNEHRRIILLSVFGPLFDDLFDDQLLEHEQIASLVAAPEQYIPVNKTDHLVKKIYLALLQQVPHRQRFIQHLQELSYWEKASLKQLSSSISKEELYEITYKKSYYAVLVFCAVLDHYPDDAMLEILYPAAGLMQLTNDVFDVWKDVQSGMYTLPNRYLNFEELQEQFMEETARINQRLLELPYTDRNKKNFSITLHTLHAMGWMALEQLRNVTREISGYEELHTLSRKELVCDLDSLKQQIKWIRHVRYFTNYHEHAHQSKFVQRLDEHILRNHTQPSLHQSEPGSD